MEEPPKVHILDIGEPQKVDLLNMDEPPKVEKAKTRPGWNKQKNKEPKEVKNDTGGGVETIDLLNMNYDIEEVRFLEPKMEDKPELDVIDVNENGSSDEASKEEAAQKEANTKNDTITEYDKLQL